MEGNVSISSLVLFSILEKPSYGIKQFNKIACYGENNHQKYNNSKYICASLDADLSDQHQYCIFQRVLHVPLGAGRENLLVNFDPEGAMSGTPPPNPLDGHERRRDNLRATLIWI